RAPPAFFIAARSRSNSRSWSVFTRGGFPSGPDVEHQAMVRIAAAGDVHASEATRSRIAEAFAAVEREADLVLLAGDLTTQGEPEQARVLADAAAGLRIPVAAVL